MDRETLIERIKEITNEYDSILNDMHDEELMYLYNDLEDLGCEVSYSD